MQWHCEGIAISTKPHGEGHAILGAFTQKYGYHKGYVFGGNGSKKRPLLELGNLLDLKWSSRFEDQLGTFSLELIENCASVFFHDAERLTALNAMSQLIYLLPEREPHRHLYEQTISMMDLLKTNAEWHIPFIFWELTFLEAIGFGLSLQKCAVTKEIDDLRYVSPKTGHAVTGVVGQKYADQLLILPTFLASAASLKDYRNITQTDIDNGFKLTSFFLEKVLREYFNTQMPEVRFRLMSMMNSHSK